MRFRSKVLRAAPRIGFAVLLMTLVFVVFLDLGLGRETIRRRIKPLIPIETRHDLVAFLTGFQTPSSPTADLEPISHIGIPPYGVNVFLEQEVEEAKVRRTMEMAREGGFTLIRQQLVWGEIEVPAKGQYIDRATGESSWAKYDRIVSLAQEYGLEVLFRIETSPVWARPGNPKLETPPDDFDDYGDFVAAVVERYQGQVRYYQIWNEPNLAFEWGGNGPAPAWDYVDMLKIGYQRAKTIDPNAVILSAALAPTIEESVRGWNDLKFLQQMYDFGAKDFFDILGSNVYGLWSGPDDRRLNVERDVNYSRPLMIREIMVRNGDAAKSIWLCEIGWNALPEDFPAPPDKILFGRVSREVQARYTARAFRRAQEEWPWVGGLMLWHFRMVQPDAPLLQHYYFNAVDEDFTPQPVYFAMRDLTSLPIPVERGFRQEDDWRLEWIGSWQNDQDDQAVLGEFRRSGQSGDALTFSFRGTRLDLVTRRGPDAGAIEVTINGQSALVNSVRPDASGRAIIDLRAPSEAWREHISIAAGLIDTVHQVEIRTVDRDDGVGDVIVDGIVVDREVGGTLIDLVVLAIGVVSLLAIARQPGRRRR
ncbi:MAG TPA: cellulase family glycosylhydrolase [Chloroflexota bacterium]|nr:cellulase family glycosylhydrolase [Chloroflexota bacterium]